MVKFRRVYCVVITPRISGFTAVVLHFKALLSLIIV
nr:MAG TPA: hypothetical protein [Caudoviricetes sp.]